MRGLIMMLFVLLMVGCQKAKMKKTEAVLTKYSWKIEDFSIESEDVMGYGYGEYTFTFGEEQGVVHAKIASLQTNVLGSWEVLKNENKASLTLKMENPLNQLTELWKIESVSKKRIVLSDEKSKKLTLVVSN